MIDGDQIDYLIELLGVYDGWSIAVYKDGSLHNRWASDDDATKPEPGYERRFQLTQEAIDSGDWG